MIISLIEANPRARDLTGVNAMLGCLVHLSTIVWAVVNLVTMNTYAEIKIHLENHLAHPFNL